MKAHLPLIFCLLLPVQPCFAGDSPFSIIRTDAGVEVHHDGKLVAGYVTKSKSKPILWPLVGPGGIEMTRGYPMRPATETERDDHPHHRSFWFTHGIVNGTDFWLEGDKGGITEHQKFTELSTGASSATIAARNIWKTPAGEPVLTEERTYTFSIEEEAVKIDCTFVVNATFGDVNFGDTKEGTFGIRIPGTMKVDAKKGGLLTNSDGDTNKDAWGKPAAWVDYTGPVLNGDGKETTMGIAILCHPETYNYPNRWHVRTYGLFAANPFGVHHFVGDKEPTAGVDLDSGNSLKFRYQVILHTDSIATSDIAEHFEQYSQSK